jgi:hypothetical protein
VNSGGQPGNDNAVKGKRWSNAIDSALANRCKSDGQKALVAIAEELLKKAELGDVSALRELGDRVDGKAHQSNSHTGADGGPILSETTVNERPKFSQDEWLKLYGPK